jgi:RNA polymerase sigma-70 factor (ECF subfamily)
MISSGREPPEKLFNKARHGDRDSQGVLLELYRNYLHLLARTQLDLHVQTRASPSDVVQETFLEAYGHFHQFRGHSEGELLGWLRRILIHQIARLVEKQVVAQKRTVRREVSLEPIRQRLHDSSETFDRALISQASSPSVQAQRRELAAVVADHLALLSPAHRDVIIFRNLEGLSFDEVACRMERTPGAVRVLWLRALEELRKLIREQEEQPE